MLLPSAIIQIYWFDVLLNNKISYLSNVDLRYILTTRRGFFWDFNAIVLCLFCLVLFSN
jgi:hypothetical protein